jgi:hypothetical protein
MFWEGAGIGLGGPARARADVFARNVHLSLISRLRYLQHLSLSLFASFTIHFLYFVPLGRYEVLSPGLLPSLLCHPFAVNRDLTRLPLVATLSTSHKEVNTQPR